MNLIDNLKYLLVQTNHNVHTLDQIKQIAPYLSDYIDLALETETYIIYFKDILTCNNLTFKILNNYIYLSEQMNSIINSKKKYIFVLFVKISHLNLDNKILNQKYIHIIIKFNHN